MGLRISGAIPCSMSMHSLPPGANVSIYPIIKLPAVFSRWFSSLAWIRASKPGFGSLKAQDLKQVRRLPGFEAPSLFRLTT